MIRTSTRSSLVATTLAALLCTTPSLAELVGQFEIRSSHPCFFAATVLEQKGRDAALECQIQGVDTCRTEDKATRFSFVTGSGGQPLIQPRVSLALINSCREGVTEIQKFGITLQLYSPRDPFAIERRFCPGANSLHSDESCCVLNLCNARFGEPGSCDTECDGTVVSLAWNVTWDDHVAAIFA
eukprot:m.19808 g.19808  ORF g.19808 m.19808 type:complete len:184 (+) comp5491_c0_seq1:149-700(+)